MSKKRLKDIIRELIEDELDEMTTTGNIAGYNTPNAFSDDEDDEKTKENSTNSTDYELVDENAFSGGSRAEKKATNKRAESLGYIMICEIEKSNNPIMQALSCLFNSTVIVPFVSFPRTGIKIILD